MVSMMESFTKIGLPPIFQQHISNASTNQSDPGGGSFSADMMDTILVTAGQASPLMQTILFVYRLIGSHLGFDPSVVLTMLGFLWGASKIGSQIYGYVEHFINCHFMCAMYVSEDDHIYQHLMKWLSQQPSIRNNQSLMAQTVWKSAWEEEDELEGALFWTDGGDDDGGDRKYLNFSNQAARSSPRFVPAMGSTKFWHKGSYFSVNRRKESLVNTSGWGAMKDLEEIRVSCFGRSIVPLKQLLADAKNLYYDDTHQKTTIYRPRAKELRRDYNMWQQVARRPVRPMRTVVLDSTEKHDVLADINEYLHPSTPRWYASRGIPLRRGYLFHGPPGTGKTSFSFALAGVFGIDIYVISLQDVNVTEEDLASLFTKLPRRCIVLLEDIDTAGLRRDSKSDPEDKDQTAKEEDKKKEKVEKKKEKAEKKKKEEAEAKNDSNSDSETSEDEQKIKKKRKQKKDGKTAATSPESISLSGLLNAIDGVASHEGRVLIMTTNKPESLDEALIRPGRVDVQVSFTNATSVQAAELFHRMYEASRSKQSNSIVDKIADKMASVNGQPKESQEELSEELMSITAEEMKSIANEFGRRIPEGTFSPAEIQGFLLKRKKCPRKAVEDVASWVEATLKQKEAHSKVLTVQ